MNTELRDAVRSATVFTTLGSEALGELTAAAEPARLGAGDLLFRQGDPADALFLVVEGHLEVYLSGRDDADPGALVVVGPGEVVGEMQIVVGGQRSSAVSAGSDCTLVRIPRGALTRALAIQPDALDAMVHGIRSRLRRNEIRRMLPRIFGPLSDEGLSEIEQRLEWLHVGRGELVMREGEPGDALYLVVSGRLEAFSTDRDGQEVPLTALAGGACIGEISMLSGGPRTASVRALRDSHLARLSRQGLDNVVAGQPGIALALARRVAEVLGRHRPRIPRKTPIKTLAVLARPSEASVSAIADRLVEHLSALGRTLRVSPGIVDEALGLEGTVSMPADAAHAIRIAAWFEEQEAHHDYLLLVADPWSTAWAQRCVQRADHVLLFADAGGDPALTDAELAWWAEDAAHRPSTTLVLIHPDDGTPPRDTLRWLSPRPLAGHLHVRVGHEGDLARLARRVTGNAIGVVLSGGGARAAGHLGALQALIDEGVPIDMIGGTSAGGGIAAQVAMGWDRDRLLTENVESFVKNNPFRAPTLPMMSLLARSKVDALARRMYGDRQIEDLWIEFFCVSCNLSTGNPVVHRHGPLWRAVRATSAIPGISVPVVQGRDVLVDGGVIDNLSVATLHALGCGTVIAVDVSTDEPIAVDFEYEDLPGPWRVLWNLVNPFLEPLAVPSIVAVLTKASSVSSIAARRQALEDADLVLQPPSGGHGTLDFSAVVQVAALAYAYATEVLRQVELPLRGRRGAPSVDAWNLSGPRPTRPP